MKIFTRIFWAARKVGTIISVLHGVRTFFIFLEQDVTDDGRISPKEWQELKKELKSLRKQINDIIH